MNNIYKVKITDPLIRGGLVIETECSEKYLVDVVETLMDKVREINKREADRVKAEKLERIKQIAL